MPASKKHQIPEWVLSCLDQYGNCACGRKLVETMGKDKLLDTLSQKGYPCELEIISDQKDVEELPKDGTYILTLKTDDSLLDDDDDEED